MSAMDSVAEYGAALFDVLRYVEWIKDQWRATKKSKTQYKREQK